MRAVVAFVAAASRASACVMALITPSCVLCRKAEPTGLTCGEAAHLHESLKVCARTRSNLARSVSDRSRCGALPARTLLSPAALVARQGTTHNGITLDGTAPL